jgi:hypothetical protein
MHRPRVVVLTTAPALATAGALAQPAAPALSDVDKAGPGSGPFLLYRWNGQRYALVKR